jgi:hypothetical protein
MAPIIIATGGKMAVWRKAYVPRRMVGEVMAQCEATRLQRTAIAHGWADFHQLVQSIREAQPR